MNAFFFGFAFAFLSGLAIWGAAYGFTLRVPSAADSTEQARAAETIQTKNRRIKRKTK